MTRNGADASYAQALGIARAEAQQKLLEVEATAMSRAEASEALEAFKSLTLGHFRCAFGIF